MAASAPAAAAPAEHGLDGYTAEAAYPAHFHRGAAPAWLHFVAGALGGTAPDPAGPYRWCELGCGTGLGAALLAAANPQAAFHAFDFNPRHVAAGRTWAEAAGLRNLAVERAAFAELAARPEGSLPRFDYIVLTGVYAWVSPANRQALRAFVQRFLAPGGLVYLSYPCHPGMAEMVPLRNLLREYAQAATGTAAQRAAAALAQLRALGHAGAAYLTSRPALLQALDGLAGADPAYLLHDHLAEHWQPQHVGDVVRDWRAAGCDWLGSAQPADNIDAVALPAAAHALLTGLPDPALRESARALAANQTLRHDIYQRTGQARATQPATHRDTLLAQRLHVLPHAHDEDVDPRAQAALAQARFAPLRALLHRQGSVSYRQAAALPAFQGEPGAVNPLFQLLAGAGAAHPVLSLTPDPAPAQALNATLCHAARQGQPIRWLAAPALGSALAATPPQMAAWLALCRPASAHARLPLAERAWRAWAGAPGSIAARSAPPPAFTQALADFESTVLPAWLRLGVIAAS